ncbi:hypothetical protein ACIBBB_29290, partial [Streptomyces sp. NPDC051217]|uniref:hypothetical protein n=1 Tax=Streptomyces sp. NPDC051217 TaxID=3365644 RepID=UPI0037B760EB
GIYGVLAWCWWISFARTVTLASGTPQISVQLKLTLVDVLPGAEEFNDGVTPDSWLPYCERSDFHSQICTSRSPVW